MPLKINNLPNLALVTPYQSLSDVVSKQSVGMFNCHVYHGSLEKAAHIAHTLDKDFYDVIISRGGTADYIEKVTNIPVVRIISSAMDLLKALLPHKESKKRIAFFNYGEYLPSVDTVADALNLTIDEFIFTNADEIQQKMQHCYQKQYDIVVGGSPILQIAKQYGLSGILIENGVESVNSALREAIAIVETVKRKHRDMARLEIILSAITEGIIVTDENNEVLYFNKTAQKVFNLNEDAVVGKQVDTVITNTRINQVLLSKSPEIRELQDIGDTSIITSRVPIFMGSKCIGVVCSFTDTPQIQKVERIIRGKLTKKGFTAKYVFNDILTNDAKLQEVVQLAKIYAQTNSPVMLYGESGTGKELFAQSIHNTSQYQHGPFVAINCAAIPEALLESELFGYEGGAFTGAKREGKEGLIELAHNGTLFLDEIGELPPTIQSRLLRVLQEYEIMRIGGKDIIPVDIRIIGATNKSLEQMNSQGLFRTDLYYRLNVLPLTLPPLRQRQRDIAFLAEHFLSDKKESYRIPHFIDYFATYPWPGNVRELKLIIERLSLLSTSFPKISWQEILELTGFNFEHFHTTKARQHIITADLSQTSLKAISKDIERKVIQFYLELYNNNQEKVINTLGISKMGLWRKLQ